MTNSGVQTGYSFVKWIRSRQTKPLYLDFSCHLESPNARRRRSGRPQPLERPKVTAVVDVETRLSARCRCEPQRHYSVRHYAERRHDSDPDSCKSSRWVSWRVPP